MRPEEIEKAPKPRRSEAFTRARSAWMENLTNLYVLKCRETGLYKVGRARCISSRIEAIAAASPVPVTLDLIVHCPAFIQLERSAHEYLAASRVRGEWFRESPELLGLIGAMRGRGFRSAHLLDHADVFEILERYFERHGSDAVSMWPGHIHEIVKARQRKTVRELLAA